MVLCFNFTKTKQKCSFFRHFPACCLSSCLNRNNQRIEFRDLTRMEQIVLQNSTPSHKPSKMCTDGSSTLLYSNRSQARDIRCLDCTPSTPQRAAGELLPKTHLMEDMCCVKHEGKSLVVVSDYISGDESVDSSAMRCYNRDGGKLMWKTKVTWDGKNDKAQGCN